MSDKPGLWVRWMDLIEGWTELAEGELEKARSNRDAENELSKLRLQRDLRELRADQPTQPSQVIPQGDISSKE